MPDAEKIKLADFIILNDGKAPLVPQILKIHDKLCKWVLSDKFSIKFNSDKTRLLLEEDRNFVSLIVHPSSLKIMLLKRVHHIAIIASNYEKSKAFYVDILGLTPIREVYRKERHSYKLDLALDGQYLIELFSFPNPPKRLSYPGSTGLRHIAFEVTDIKVALKTLAEKGIIGEPIRVDDTTGKQFSFFADPDGLPIELYEQ